MAFTLRHSMCIRAALALALAALAATPTLAAPSLEALLARLAPAEGRFESAYTQTRESTLLSDPVRTRGHIVYESPGYLRMTERGRDIDREILIREGTVEIRGSDQTRRFPLSRARPLEQLMRLLEALATGDSAALKRHFDVRLEGSDTDWTLLLEDPGTRRGGGNPHEDALRITVEGGEAVERIVLQPRDGQARTLELGPES